MWARYRLAVSKTEADLSFASEELFWEGLGIRGLGLCWARGVAGSAELSNGKSAALYCSGMLKSKAVWLTSEMERRDPFASLYQLPAGQAQFQRGQSALLPNW